MKAGEAWRPDASPARFTALLLIAGAHVFVVGAVAVLGGTRAIAERARPLFVQFVALPPTPPSPAPPRVPLPPFRAPEIRLPEPPVIETIAVHLDEKPATPSELPPAANAVLAMRAPADAAPAGATQPPRFDLAYLNNPAPAYPPLSRRLREEGRVVLRVLVNASGLVEAIEIMTPSGHARLDETALAAVRRWRFVPARAGDRTIAGWAIVPIAFNLQG